MVFKNGYIYVMNYTLKVVERFNLEWKGISTAHIINTKKLILGFDDGKVVL